MAKRAPFKRGDIVQYCASLDLVDTNFIEMHSKHETSIGIVEGVDRGDVTVAWISHNFPQWKDLPRGWSPDVLKKIGHVDIDVEEVPDAKGEV